VLDEVKEAQKRVDNWNRLYESGQKVIIKGVFGKDQFTEGRAFVSGHKAMVRLKGERGNFELKALAPVIK
jgi:hypothetical protein